MVEFALVLPILALLLVMTIDLGRVFFGWVGLQNVARIAANHAGSEPDAWAPPLDGNKLAAQQRYEDLIANEADALNCSLRPVADPVFEDATGDADADDPGDMAIVSLICGFDLLTPLASILVSGTIDLGAKAEFPIRRAIDVELAAPPPPLPTPTPVPTPTPGPTSTPAPCAKPVANFTGTPTSGKNPLVVTFTDTSTAGATCPVTGWLWEFGDGTTSVAQNPTKTYTHSGSPPTKKFAVKLTVTATSGTDAETKPNYVTVSAL
nr:pilus assembly protein [Actinomycetota bacterium]